MEKFAAVRAYFRALSQGDPVAIGFTLFFVVLGMVLGLFAWVMKQRMQADDRRWKEHRRRRRGF